MLKSLPRHQFYVPLPFHTRGQEVMLDKELSHRLLRVRRLKEGEIIHLINGTDGLWEARLDDAKARHVTLVRQVCAHVASEPLLLALCLPKRDAWETALRQATELGVTEIFPLVSDFAQRDHVNPERANALMVEAVEQCERLDVPVLHPVTPLKTWVDMQQRPFHWAYERNETAEATKVAGPCLLVGPEGGFSGPEVEFLGACNMAVPCTLGPYILRTDTAVAVGLGIVRHNGAR